MSKASGARRGKTKTHRRPSRPSKPSASANDGGFYAAIIIIGIAVIVFGILVSEGQYGGVVTVGYVTLLAILINFFAMQAYRGSTLASWKQSLARVPLRAAGFGTRHGRPLEAAHGAAAAKRTLIISTIASLLIIAGLTVWLIPGVLPT